MPVFHTVSGLCLFTHLCISLYVSQIFAMSRVLLSNSLKTSGSHLKKCLGVNRLFALSARQTTVAPRTSLPRFLSSSTSMTTRSMCPCPAPHSRFQTCSFSTTANQTADKKPEEKKTEEKKEEKKTEVDVLKEEVADLKSKYLSALAEQQNILTRMNREIDNSRKYGVQNFGKDLLEVADVLEMASAAIKPEQAAENTGLATLLEGVKMTQTNMQKAFHKHGMIKFDSLGLKFDPTHHDGVFQMDDPTKEPGTVGVVINEGYKLHDRVIRPARVGDCFSFSPFFRSLLPRAVVPCTALCSCLRLFGL